MIPPAEHPADHLAVATPALPRPFLFLEPMPATVRKPVVDPVGLEVLADRASDQIPALVRSLVRHTMSRSAGPLGRQPIALAVLNRRRRAARAWLVAVLAGQVDQGTLHSVAHQWLPLLAGTGPEPAAALGRARNCVEFVRGALTAVIFDRPEANLLPQARALHALETVLAAHLGALREWAERAG